MIFYLWVTKFLSSNIHLSEGASPKPWLWYCWMRSLNARPNPSPPKTLPPTTMRLRRTGPRLHYTCLSLIYSHITEMEMLTTVCINWLIYS